MKRLAVQVIMCWAALAVGVLAARVAVAQTVSAPVAATAQPAASAKPGAAKPHDAKASPLIGLFKDLCGSDLQDVAAMKAKAKRLGWATVADTAHAELASMLKISRSTPVEKTHLQAYARTLDGQRYFAVLSGVKARDITAHGCYVYDFAASDAKPLAAKPLTAWLGAKPRSAVFKDGTATRVWHLPPNLFGYAKVLGGFFPAGSAAAKKVGFDGATLGATFVVK
ncbi:MAG: hypothetical protein AAFR04_02985 [Pseudomonadota bacterium]